MCLILSYLKCFCIFARYIKKIAGLILYLFIHLFIILKFLCVYHIYVSYILIQNFYYFFLIISGFAIHFLLNEVGKSDRFLTKDNGRISNNSTYFSRYQPANQRVARQKKCRVIQALSRERSAHRIHVAPASHGALYTHTPTHACARTHTRTAERGVSSTCGSSAGTGNGAELVAPG